MSRAITKSAKSLPMTVPASRSKGAAPTQFTGSASPSAVQSPGRNSTPAHAQHTRERDARDATVAAASVGVTARTK